MVKAASGGATGVASLGPLEFNENLSNLVAYDPVDQKLYDYGPFSQWVNLQMVSQADNVTFETLRFEGFPTAFSVPYGTAGFANEMPSNLISISDVAAFEDLYPWDNVFTVFGNMSARYYHGDATYLSNIQSNLQTIAEMDANTFRTLVLANAITAFEAVSYTHLTLPTIYSV